MDWTKTNTKTLREAQTLTYDYTLNDIHKFNVMVGQELVSDQSNYNYVYATGYSKDLTPEKIFANIGLI